jgi:hypothetical protein
VSRANEVAAGVVSAFNVAAAPTPDLSNTAFYADKPVAGLVEGVADMAEADHDARQLLRDRGHLQWCSQLPAASGMTNPGGSSVSRWSGAPAAG